MFWEFSIEAPLINDTEEVPKVKPEKKLELLPEFCLQREMMNMTLFHCLSLRPSFLLSCFPKSFLKPFSLRLKSESCLMASFLTNLVLIELSFYILSFLFFKLASLR